ncbi:MAG: class I SAM-dependent methyltransferase [Acidimicrobiia bacterium]|nr:class I SAM-dependent methyltransferase [Acidimicrobiia bacterium]MDH3470100.1 class I SAM-dependent methyltransferase [Acidimicrobiia bacterium]
MPDDTSSDAYAERLQTSESVWWKRLFRAQAVYRRNLRRLKPGFTLDIGCGLGRNLGHLDGNGVGVDHNDAAVAEARRRGFDAFSPDEFASSRYNVPGRFDALLLAHVVEHMRYHEAVELVSRYLPYLKPGGRVILICPQEAGFRSDPTHVEFADFEVLRRLCTDIGLTVAKAYSHPLPRFAGRWFRYNEFVVVASPAA